MRRCWTAPLLLSLAAAALAGPQQTVADFVARLDDGARRHLRLDAETLSVQLGLNVDSDCLAHLRTSQDATSCWRDVSSTALGWRGAAGLSAAGGNVMLSRSQDGRSCLPLADFVVALPAPPQRLPQMTGLGHQMGEGIEATVPVFQPRLTWRYASPQADRMTQLWVDVDGQGCVNQINLLIDGPMLPER